MWHVKGAILWLYSQCLHSCSDCCFLPSFGASSLSGNCQEMYICRVWFGYITAAVVTCHISIHINYTYSLKFALPSFNSPICTWLKYSTTFMLLDINYSYSWFEWRGKQKHSENCRQTAYGCLILLGLIRAVHSQVQKYMQNYTWMFTLLQFVYISTRTHIYMCTYTMSMQGQIVMFLWYTIFQDTSIKLIISSVQDIV